MDVFGWHVRSELPKLGDRRSRNARAVVTGAGSGIGRGFAVELGRRGGQVVCSDVRPQAAKETLALVEAAGGRGTVVECDVTSLEQVTQLADAAEAFFDQPVSLVINNAGVAAGGEMVGESSYAEWRHVLDVNLWGVIHGCHVFAPRLRTAGSGGVINVASSASFISAPQMAAYNVSKAGVVALSETLAAEFSGTDIAVTVLCPTFVKTSLVENSDIETSAAHLATRVMRVAGTPADRIARAALGANDRGRLHAVPQLDGQVLWRTKRLAPEQYARAMGLVGRARERIG